VKLVVISPPILIRIMDSLADRVAADETRMHSQVDDKGL
jgi:hypothetical protein